MMKHAPWAMTLALLSAANSAPAYAGRSQTNVVVVGRVGHSPFFHTFHRPFFHPFFPSHRAFFRSQIFVGAPLFSPLPVTFYQPLVYYGAPPAYSYPLPPAAGAPSGGTSYRPEDCRQVQTTITLDGEPQPLVGTVCKGPDGNWHRVN